MSIITISILLTTCSMYAAEYHVSPGGLDSNKGSKSKPFKTISAAASIAQPGDTITVHEGTYRERINPPRGGTSDDKRIVYQAAAGEKVVIKGSEIVTGWKKAQNDTWKTVLPNSFFGNHNPYKIRIHGDWFKPLGKKGRVYHTGSVYLNDHWLVEAESSDQVLGAVDQTPLWFGEVDDENTTLYAQFKGVDPNTQTVEVNAREAVFYPEKTGINYITVRGFVMEHAAPNWAPPTAEQVGLIGTHWSKGWVIENNTIRYSICCGITLGKYGDQWDNTAPSSIWYINTIKRALENGWSKENIGHHVVRDNHISHCEQAGIVGSMGGIFSTITGNTICEINMRGFLGGMEMAGIKFHGSIDTVISCNHLYRCGGAGAIWLDWMAQGTRVTRNLFHDNSYDLSMEVNHGPYLIDNNLFLSKRAIRESSQGAAYVHNLISSGMVARPSPRATPYFKPHSVQGMDFACIAKKDIRSFNNLFFGQTSIKSPRGTTKNIRSAGNTHMAAAGLKLEEKEDGLWISFPAVTATEKCAVVTTELLGKAMVPDAPFENPDGSPYRLDTDYFGNKRTENPAPGPFVGQGDKKVHLKVWPLE